MLVLFEVVHGYTPRKPLDLLPMSPHVRISKSAETFARHIHDLHNEKFMMTFIGVMQSFR